MALRGSLTLLSRDLGFSMWQNGAPLEARKAQAKQLRRLIAIELSEDDVDTVSKEDKRALLDHYERTEEEIDRLIEPLLRKRSIQHIYQRLT